MVVAIITILSALLLRNTFEPGYGKASSLSLHGINTKLCIKSIIFGS